MNSKMTACPDNKMKILKEDISEIANRLENINSILTILGK